MFVEHVIEVSCIVVVQFVSLDVLLLLFFLRIRRPPISTQGRSSAASDVYKRQVYLNGSTDYISFYSQQILETGACSFTCEVLISEI